MTWRVAALWLSKGGRSRMVADRISRWPGMDGREVAVPEAVDVGVAIGKPDAVVDVDAAVGTPDAVVDVGEVAGEPPTPSRGSQAAAATNMTNAIASRRFSASALSIPATESYIAVAQQGREIPVRQYLCQRMQTSV